MGCGSSNVAQDPLAKAAPVGPAEPALKSSSDASSSSAVVEGKATAGGSPAPAAAAAEGAATTEKKEAEVEGAKGTAAHPAAGKSEAAVTPVAEGAAAAAAPAPVVAPVDPAVIAAVEAADRTGKELFAAPPADADAIAALPIDPSYDSPVTNFLGEGDIAAVVSYLADTSECALFAEATATLEIAPQSIAELILLAGSPEAVIASCRALDASGSRFPSLLELAPAMHEQAAKDVARAVSHIDNEALKKSVADCHAILSKSTCELFPYALVPTVSAAASEAAAGSDGEDSELDFNQVNQQLIGTRMRLLFLAPAFLVQLAHAGGRSSDSATASWNAALILHHLSLSELKFDLPSELLKGVFSYRILAQKKRETLLKTAAAAPSKEDEVAPEALQVQIAPLQKSLGVLEPSCKVLTPLMEPLIPTLSSLTPTMRHLQIYLSRFLPLLQQSHKDAVAASVQPADDSATGEILQAYLIPFLKLMQPWIIQLRPYLAGLQPFFNEVQPFLGHTHGFFVLLQPFLHSLSPSVAEGAEKPFVLTDKSFNLFLKQDVSTLILLHPVLKQLHPLMQGLLEFIQELGVFLSQLQELLDLLLIYQTEPLEPEAEEEEDNDDENEVSSIARPWFKDNEEENAAQGEKMSAPRFLSKHGKFLGKLSPYTSQLRPFAGQVKEFVEKFVPFVVQLAPFYKDALKALVTPLLFFLVPLAQEDEEAPTQKAKGPTQAELDEIALQKLLSS